MKCILLAAGYATRLYPLTENFPKPLLKVGEKTILDWLIDDTKQSGLIDQYIVISNHKFAAIFEDWAKGRSDILVVDDGTSTNDTRLGAVKDIQFAIEKAHLDDDVLILAGDNVLDFSLTKFIDYAKEKDTSCVMRFYEPDMAKMVKCSQITVDPDDLVLSMIEKPANPTTHWICPPFYFYKKEDIRRIPEALNDGCGADAPGSFVSWLCGHAKIHAMEMPGSRYDIGNLASYEYVKQTYKGITK